MSARRVAALACVLALAAGCSYGGLYGVPLPGGADIGDQPIRVTAVFGDVLDLVPQAGVKVADVPVGRVESIDLADDGRSACVRLVVDGSVRLAGNAEARLRQSSALGEKFVELADPPAPAGSLRDGAEIPLASTNRNPEVEEVLGALSLLLNGGGIGQAQRITRELNAALTGNEPRLRALLDNLRTFVGGLDEQRDEIVRAIKGLDTLAAGLRGRTDRITGLVDDLGPGVRVLAEQRAQFTTLLTSLDSLSTVAVDTIDKSSKDMVADLKALEPTLRELAKAGQDLPKAMEVLLTFPFPDSALDAVKGDYLNTYLRLRTQTGKPRAVPGMFPLPPVDGLGEA